MTDMLLLIPVFLWLFTYGITSVFYRMVKKKLGAGSKAYADLKLPVFISNLLNSIASVGLMLFVMNSSVSPEGVTYFVVPYFGIIAYSITSGFRTLKDARNGRYQKNFRFVKN